MAQLAVTQFATPVFVGRLTKQRASDVLAAGPLLENQTIRFGTALVVDPNANGAVKLPSAGTQKLLGVCYDAATLQMALANDAAVPAFGQGDAVTYCKRASMGVAPEQTVTTEDAVYVRFTAGAGELKPGRFRKDDGSTNGEYVLTFAGSPTAASVDVGDNTVAADISTPEAFAGLLAAQPGVVSAVADGTITVVTLPGFALSNASVTGSGASVALTNPTPAVTPIAFLAPNARWITAGTANPDMLGSIDACEIEINTP